ncbi:MAG: hypothetical protein KIT84_03490 [Labilithrix sp.]|nr:hypothetical protein [Labilithrix sp.]MCW5810047.1 hypothetical protein [Labilithrix sp.]
MATKKKTGKTSKKDKRGGTKRQERRFVSQSSTSPALVKGLGAIAALALGAGLYAYFYGQSFNDDATKAIPSYVIAAGAVLMGATIWLGTSAENPVRVGAPGISVEKGDLRRMPWWGIDKITFEAGSLSLVVAGRDESNVDWTFKVSVKAHPEAVGWIIREAQDRVPRRVDVPEETLEKLPSAPEHAGQKLDLEPLQVVGKRCAQTGKTISYEPDARVCPRCERVYAKRHVPKKCKCGNSLVHLQPTDVQEEEDDDDDDEDRTSSKKLEAAEEAES